MSTPSSRPRSIKHYGKFAFISVVLYTEQTEFNTIFVLLHGLKKEKKKKGNWEQFRKTQSIQRTNHSLALWRGFICVCVCALFFFLIRAERIKNFQVLRYCNNCCSSPVIRGAQVRLICWALQNSLQISLSTLKCIS